MLSFLFLTSACSCCFFLSFSLPMPQLLGQFLDMLNSVGLIGSQYVESNELGIIESTMRVLLSCISHTDPDVSSPWLLSFPVC